MEVDNCDEESEMAEGGTGFGKVVLYVVLGVLAVVVGVQVIQWFFGILGYLIIVAAVIGVGYLVYRAGQRSVGGGRNRGQLPR